jgi:hypothetical protein
MARFNLKIEERAGQGWRERSCYWVKGTPAKVASVMKEELGASRDETFYSLDSHYGDASSWSRSKHAEYGDAQRRYERWEDNGEGAVRRMVRTLQALADDSVRIEHVVHIGDVRHTLTLLAEDL